MAEAEVSLVGAGLTIQGTVRGDEELHVEGTVDGAVALGHHLHVAEPGAVHGEVSVLSATVAGQASGKLAARDYVQLLPGAQVRADLQAPRVILETGCKFVGRIDMDFPVPE